MVDQVLDAQGLSCPVPVLQAKKALKSMEPGATLKIIATDPGAKADFEAFCRSTGNTLVDSQQDGKVFSFLIKRTA